MKPKKDDAHKARESDDAHKARDLNMTEVSGKEKDVSPATGCIGNIMHSSAASCANAIAFATVISPAIKLHNRRSWEGWGGGQN